MAEVQRQKERQKTGQRDRNRGREGQRTSPHDRLTPGFREGVERQHGGTHRGRGLASRAVPMPSRAPGFRGGGGEGSSGLTSLLAKSR